MADNQYKIELGVKLDASDLKSEINKIDGKHKVKLGVDLGVKDIQDRIRAYNNNSNNIKVKLKATLDTDDLKKQINKLNLSTNVGDGVSIPVNTRSLEESLERVERIIGDVRNSLGTIDDKSGVQSLVASVNQIATALGKAEDESDSLIKSLNTLSKKEFGFNFNLKTGNTNPVKAATDYGIEARRKAIPAMQEQVAYLKNILGGTEKADKALERYLVKLHKGFGGVTEKNRLQQEMVGGVGSDGKQISYNKQMGAYEQTIDHLKKIIVESGKSLAGFDAKFSKSAENIVDDTVKIQTGAKQTEEALESVGKEMKQIFGGGIGAEQLSGQLEPIITDLKKIREAIEGLSKGVSFDSLTASFDRLSGSIENLLTNAEKVKGILNSGFDSPSIDTNIDSTGVTATSQKKAQKQANSYLDSYLKYWNISGEDAKTTRSKFASFVESSGGLDSASYDAAVEDLANTIKQLGTASRQADDYLEKVFNTLRTYNIDAPRDTYKQDFGDDWSTERSKHQAILANKNSKTRLPVDVAYQELGEMFSSLFPKDILNPSDQLKKIFEVYDIAKDASKDRLVSLSEQYSDSDLRGEVLDIVSTMQEQVKAEKELAKSSAQTTNSIVQDEARKRQEYEKTLAQKKQELDGYSRLIAEYEDVINDPAKLRADTPEGQQEELQMYMDGLDAAYGERNNLVAEIKQIESALESETQQAKQTADVFVQSEIEKQQATEQTAKEFLAVQKGIFQRAFLPSDEKFGGINNTAKSVEEYFRSVNGVLADTVSVQERFDADKNLNGFTVSLKNANGAAEQLRYTLRTIEDTGEVFFEYTGGSVNDNGVLKRMNAISAKADSLQNKLDKLKSEYSDPNASKPIKDAGHISALSEQYEKVKKAILEVRNADESTFASMVSNAEKEKTALENMVREFKNAETVATSLRSKDIDTVKSTYASKLDVLTSKMKNDGVYTSGFEKGAENLRSVLSNATDASGLVLFLNGLDKLEAGYKRATAAKKEFNQSQKVGIKVSGLQDSIKNIQRISPEIDNFETEINGAKVSVQSLLNDLKQVRTQGDFSVVKENFRAFKEAAQAAGIAISETVAKVKNVNEIKIKLSDTGFDGFEQEVQRAHAEAEKLEYSTDELESALRELDVAMEAVYSADQSGDIKRLVSANEEYESSLKKVYSQLKLNQQAEKDAYKAEMLEQKKASLSSEMEIWLKENTKATRDFGEEIKRLQASLDGLDDRGVNLVGKQFKNITKQAQAMGKTGLTVFDKLKSKAKEYMTYLSAAELFMYAEQAFRSMFEQVKLIDSAMTELKKVTDETDASYDKFLTNAATRAKEIGTTIDGLVASTADFARLGFGFKDAQGLAEVANIYAVVGDDIDSVETATQSLISTLTAFKNEANGLSDSDFAMSIVDKMNEVDIHAS